MREREGDEEHAEPVDDQQEAVSSRAPDSPSRGGGRGGDPGAGGATSDAPAINGDDIAVPTEGKLEPQDHGVEQAEDATRAELIEETAERVLEQVIEHSISGPVPSPDLLAQYTPDQQERIFRIAESFSTDESKRRDIVAGTSARVAERAQWIMPATLAGAFIFAAGTYALWQNVVFSALFLSVPVLRVVGAGVATIVRSGKSPRADDD